MYKKSHDFLENYKSFITEKKVPRIQKLNKEYQQQCHRILLQDIGLESFFYIYWNPFYLYYFSFFLISPKKNKIMKQQKTLCLPIIANQNAYPWYRRNLVPHINVFGGYQ